MLRKTIAKLHLWLGLTSGLVVFVVAITGALYVFEEEARDVFQHKYFYVDETSLEKKSLYQMSAIIKKEFPEEKITQIRFKSETNAAYIYHTKSKKAISIDPYTLHIKGIRDLEADFFAVILDLHVDLKMGDIGKEIIKYNVLIFLILNISGLVLWWPKQRRFLKQALSIKWKTKNIKRLNWDLHSVLGFYALAIMLIVSLTGVFWVFDSAKLMLSLATGYPQTNTKSPEIKSNKEAGFFLLEDAYYKAKKQYHGETQTFLSLPDKPNQAIRVLFRYPYAIVRKQNTLFYHPKNGDLLRADLFKNYNAYDVMMRSNYDFHTGRIRFLGLGSKILYFFASLICASLPITGFLVWRGRQKKAKPKP